MLASRKKCSRRPCSFRSVTIRWISSSLNVTVVRVMLSLPINVIVLSLYAEFVQCEATKRKEVHH